MARRFCRSAARQSPFSRGRRQCGQLERRSAQVVVGAAVTGIGGQQNDTLAVEQSGTVPVIAGLVIVATAVRRNLALAEEAGLCHEWGILEDASLGTSTHGIYACGDLVSAEIKHFAAAQCEAAWACIAGTAEHAGADDRDSGRASAV